MTDLIQRLIAAAPEYRIKITVEERAELEVYLSGRPAPAPRRSAQGTFSAEVARHMGGTIAVENYNDHFLRKVATYNRVLAEQKSQEAGEADENLDDPIDWSLPEKHVTWRKRFNVSERTLRNYVAAGTLRMKKVPGQSGMWRVHVKDPLYITWQQNRRSLSE